MLEKLYELGIHYSHWLNFSVSVDVATVSLVAGFDSSRLRPEAYSDDGRLAHTACASAAGFYGEYTRVKAGV